MQEGCSDLARARARDLPIEAFWTLDLLRTWLREIFQNTPNGIAAISRAHTRDA
jgi:hypothetical protein